MGDLIDLARRYVALNDELETVRDQIKRAVMNGGADPPKAPFARPARSPGGSQHPAAIKAAEAEQTIMVLLKDRPGMRTSEIARKTSSKTTAVNPRLQRLRSKGLIERDEANGWAASG